MYVLCINVWFFFLSLLLLLLLFIFSQVFTVSNLSIDHSNKASRGTSKDDGVYHRQITDFQMDVMIAIKTQLTQQSICNCSAVTVCLVYII
jgi:hypothetical protein